MKAFGLFSGVGGLELGLQRAGAEIVGHCEIDEGARAVLDARFPYTHRPAENDVRRLQRLPRGTKVLTAGFPCQDLSQVGTTQGLRGKNSGLVREVFRLLEASPVNTVVLENVPFMLRLRKGAALRAVVSQFEGMGYSWAYRVVNTRAFGIPQRRERVFLIAMRRGDPRRVLFGDEATAPEPRSEMMPSGATGFGFYWTEGNRGIGWGIDEVPTIKGGSSIGVPSPPAIWFPRGRGGYQIVTPSLNDAERLQGFRTDWTQPAELGDERRQRIRWKLVGNAVSPPITTWIGDRLVALDRDPLDVETWELDRTSPWPNAAFGDGRGRFGVALSSWPFRRGREETLERFLKHPVSPLSFRATSGFASRLAGSGLLHPEQFMAALRQHARKMC